jgi:hypothetical protein
LSSEKCCALAHYYENKCLHHFEYKLGTGKQILIECLSCKTTKLEALTICAFGDKLTIICENCVVAKLSGKTFEKSPFVDGAKLSTKIIPSDTALNEAELEFNVVDERKSKQLMNLSRKFIVIPDTLNKQLKDLKCSDGNSALFNKLKNLNQLGSL